MHILAAKLARQRADEQRRAREIARTEALATSNWGNQRRSYTLQPYTLAKDHRTGVERTDVDSVLREGDLGDFIEAALELDLEPP